MKQSFALALLGCAALGHLASAQTGRILFERWDDSTITDLSDLTYVQRFVGLRPPTAEQYLAGFDTGENLGSRFVGRISGWLVIPLSGNYTFSVASDDSSRVWLSTDSTQAHSQLICSVDGWTGYQEWDRYPTQQSQPIALQAGQSYWIEALWQENTGGDHLSLAWEGPVGDRAVISGAFLADFLPISWIAQEPDPVNGGRNVDPNQVVLSWEAGTGAPTPVSHYEVYFSSDVDLLGQAAAQVCTVDAQAPLQCTMGTVAGGVQYYWRVDAIIDAQTRGPGATWTFVTDIEAIEICPPGVPCTTGPLVINEIHYDPEVKTDLTEFVELYNITEESLDLSGWYFSRGIAYRFPEGAVIGPRGFAVIAAHAENFKAKFGYAPDGQFTGNLRNEGDDLRLRDTADALIDSVDYQLGFPWPTVGDPPDRSIQLISPAMDNDLGGSWRGAEPTPGGHNRILSVHAPPLLRQVKNTPKIPLTHESTLITAKVTDVDGVQGVTLSYQIVEPGDYFGLHDSRYATQWIQIPMVDDGTGGDVTEKDDTYTAAIPADIQVHRRLIRYRITAVDTLGLSVSAPYADDPQPNFAYFVYDGVPAWTGAVQPGVSPQETYDFEVMRSLPVYHLLSKKSDVETATWQQKYGGSQYRWHGTLVYDGEVYDHVNYRMRGGVWRYAMGKNMWKFDFLRGHYFQARDDYGNQYREKWDKLNFSACIQQGSFGQRGEQGMIEALTFKMFNLTDVPAPHTHWLQFRVIDEANEEGRLNGPHPGATQQGTQYDGDLWGLYMAIEQMDGQFLDEHRLPDGNLYKMEARYGEKNNQGATAVSDSSDIRWFKDNYESNSEAGWWGTHVNLDRYYSHVAVQHACHHGDVTGKNHFFYLNPEPTTNEWGTSSRWSLLPWDVDLTWTTYYGGMSDPFSRAGLQNRSPMNTQMKNRVREVCDLLFNSDQTGQLIDEMAAIIADPNGGPDMVDVDRAMWDYHWVMKASAYLSHSPSFKAGQDRFYRAAQNAGLERSFEGMCQLLKDYVQSRQNHMTSLHRDNAIPHKPDVAFVGLSDFAANDLVFGTTPFSDPQGAQTFGAMAWRIAEVRPGSVFDPGQDQDGGVVLIDQGQSWKYFKGMTEPSAPGVWREIGFAEVNDWLSGPTPIGYGESFVETNLTDMRGAYTTVYFRKAFSVDDPDSLASLKVLVKYDDGFNAWINGTRVAWANVNSENEPFDATSVTTSSENHNFIEFTQSDLEFLQAGENVLAVQVMNTLLSNSSDFFFDATLIGVSAGDEADSTSGPPRPRGPGKYEIQTVWQSETLDAYAETVTIPATVVVPGHTYRVRCRMMDTDGRWSHWSDPQQFDVSEPLNVGVVQNLRITEVMYNPADPSGASVYDNDDFEFIELKNTGDEILTDLSSVSFTDGVSFDFAHADITHLEPGEFLLVVGNRAAFAERYGEALGPRIAGEFNGQRLSNSGENLRLEDFWNGIIVEFEYDDAPGWPQAADGDGFSLVPLDEALPDHSGVLLNDPANWRASTHMHGSPGSDDL